jgi:hypothetical protein
MEGDCGVSSQSTQEQSHCSYLDIERAGKYHSTDAGHQPGQLLRSLSPEIVSNEWKANIANEGSPVHQRDHQ